MTDTYSANNRIATFNDTNMVRELKGEKRKYILIEPIP
jgi:hypothetical protein